MKLFLIQDDDRPAYVMAYDYHSALTEWRRQINTENPEFEATQPDATPDGIQLVADDDKLLIVCESPKTAIKTIIFNGLN